MSGPLLTCQRLELWQPLPDDLADLHALMDDEQTVRFVGNHVPTLADNFARLLRNAGSWSLYGYGTFMVRQRGKSRIVGSCGVFRSFRGFGAEKGFDGAAEAGWIIHRDHWGQGYAGEAMAAAMAWFDREHGPRPVVCMIEEGNAASVRVAKALGFVAFGRHDDNGAVLTLYRRN